MLLFSSQFLIPQGELEPVSGRPLRWECHWLSASPPNLTARRQQRDLLYCRERQGAEGDSVNEGKDESEEKEKRQESWRSNVSLTAGENMIRGLWPFIYLQVHCGFLFILGLRMASSYTHSWKLEHVLLSLLCVVCQHVHWSHHSLQRAVMHVSVYLCVYVWSTA